MKRLSLAIKLSFCLFCLSAMAIIGGEDLGYWPEEIGKRDRKWVGGALTLSNAFSYNENTSIVDHWVAAAPRIDAGDFDEDGKMDLLIPMTYGQYGESLFDDIFVGTWPSALLLCFGDGEGSIDGVLRLHEDVDRESVTAADVDADGHLDAVTRVYGDPVGARYPDEQLCIIFGDGTGAFPQTNSLITDGFESCGRWLVADMTGDGIPDLVSVGLVDREATFPAIGSCVIPGAGNREFGTPLIMSFDFGGFPYPSLFELVNVNGDGSMDLVASVVDFERNQTEDDVAARYDYDERQRGAFDRILVVCENDGEGNLSVTDERMLSVWPLDLVVGDVDGDGRSDLAFTSGLPGDMAKQAWVKHTELVGRQWGKLNPLGNFWQPFQDDVPETTITVLLGDGEGSFGDPFQWDTGLIFALLRVTDLNGDQLSDLVLFALYGRVLVYHGSTETVLTGPEAYSSATATHNPNWSVVLTDMNGDTLPDFAVPSMTASLLVRFGNGRGGFGTGWFAPPIPSQLSDWGDPRGSPVDMDQDGHLDVVGFKGLFGKSTAWIAYGNGNGAFPDTVSIAVPDDILSNDWYSIELHEIAVGDFNGDGRTDILGFFSYRNKKLEVINTMRLFLNEGGRSFLESKEELPAIPWNPTEATAADFNNDGYDDVFVSYTVRNPNLFLGSESGLSERGAVELDPALNLEADMIRSHKIGDFNEDGSLDLLGKSLETYSFVLLLGDGQGTLSESLRFARGELLLGAVDMDEDGHLDVYAHQIYLGRGDGTFDAPIQETEFMGVPAADFNQDGHLDYIIDKIGVTRIALGDGKLGIYTEEHFATDTRDTPSAVGADVWGDFNEDGWLDLVVLSGDMLHCLLNRFKEVGESL